MPCCPSRGSLLRSRNLDERIAVFLTNFQILIRFRLVNKVCFKRHHGLSRDSFHRWTPHLAIEFQFQFLFLQLSPLALKLEKAKAYGYVTVGYHLLQMTRSEYAFLAFCPGGRGVNQTGKSNTTPIPTTFTGFRGSEDFSNPVIGISTLPKQTQDVRS